MSLLEMDVFGEWNVYLMTQIWELRITACQ